mmetsp:Transcript_8942/g.23266  ORF Transcript_8942/g.23266 Transcript_8942/m.23266 type:complete len:460 (-) Transcript_8942:136-1515(-)
MAAVGVVGLAASPLNSARRGRVPFGLVWRSGAGATTASLACELGRAESALTMPVVLGALWASGSLSARGRKRGQRARRAARGALGLSMESVTQDVWLFAGMCVGEHNKRKAQLEVSRAMSSGEWPKTDPSAYEVEEMYGGSWSTEAVFAVRSPFVGATPDRVVFKSYTDTPMRMNRLLSASKAFAAVGGSPTPISAGDNWVIESFGGEVPDFGPDAAASTLRSCQALGSLAATLHEAPAGWFEAWRANIVDTYPALNAVPTGSALWPLVAYNTDGVGRFARVELELLCALLPEPASGAGRRVVSTHGDLHEGNTLMTSAGVLMAVDYEFSCVSTAVQDLMYKALGLDGPMKRALCSAYLEAAAIQASPEEVDTLAFDVSIAAVVHFGLLRRVFCWNLPTLALGLSHVPLAQAVETLRDSNLKQLVQRAQADPERRARVVDHPNVSRLIQDVWALASLLE